VEQAIVDAVHGELTERGYAGVTFEGVARRAGTSKPVVYRRYASRPALVHATLHHLYGDAPPPAPTATLRGDLLAWLEAARSRATAIGARTYRAHVGESDEQVRDAFRDFVGGWVADLEREVLVPARARGELSGAPLDPVVLSVPIVLLRDRVIFGSSESVDVAAIVDDVFLPLLRARSPAATVVDGER
jgi:AcrR family transcriptional regulator